MLLKIKELIIWPGDASLAPSSIDFPLDKVSVITGWSETGKSSILSIIDYCLGAEKCTVPVGPIRTKVAWFGLRLITATGIVRVARCSPGSGAASDDYELLTQERGETPAAQRPLKNLVRSDFKSRMDALSGLSNLPLSADEAARGWRERAAFRDMAAFNFLPQHIIANPHTLFFKADTVEHRKRLEKILPFVLGRKTNEQLVLEHRLSDLRKQEVSLKEQIESRSRAADTWRAEVAASFLHAQELNLIPPDEVPGDMESNIGRLQAVVEGWRSLLDRSPADATSAVQSKLRALREQEYDLDRKLRSLRKQLNSTRSLGRGFTSYGHELAKARERVRGLPWFEMEINGPRACPICGTEQDSAKRTIESMREPIAELERISRAATDVHPILDKEAADLETEIHRVEEGIYEIRRTRRIAEGEAGNGEALGGQRLEDVLMFLGAVTQGLRLVRGGRVDGDLEGRLRKVRSEIGAIRAQISNIPSTTSGVDPTEAISALIQRHADALQLGHRDSRPTIDEGELNIRFEGADMPAVAGENRRRRSGELLWEIGSGANWMGYHLAAFLALHEHFTRRGPASPVPSFLVLDQPSQVYFPSDSFKEKVEADTRGSQNVLSDLAKTQLIFELLAEAHKSQDIDIQIIVVEHADERTWQGLEESIEKVADWRGSGEKLVPQSWIEPQ